MARRTKEEAQETRTQLLDTAERVFREKGVSHTSLSDIAIAAGVTRGAIYWHFSNKAELFVAMCDRATLPLETMFSRLADPELVDPLGKLRESVVDVLSQVEQDQRCRRVFEILNFKCEFVDDLAPTMLRRKECRQGAKDVIERNLAMAVARGQIPADTDVRRAAIGLFSYVDGLIVNWSMEPDSYSLAQDAGRLIDFYLSGLRQGGSGDD
jgi:TetR/AcrR family transcriptional regulator, acrAB operon repressor